MKQEGMAKLLPVAITKLKDFDFVFYSLFCVHKYLQ